MPREALADIEKKIRTLRAKLNRPEKRGDDPRPVMVPASEAPNVYFLRRPSGIVELDLHIGGGAPAGGLVYLSGPDSAGKTFLLHKFFAQLQRLYGHKARIGYGVTESSVDHLRMRATGVQVAVPDETIRAMNQARKERGEATLTKEEVKELQTEVGGVEIVRERSAERMLDTVITMVDSRAFDIIALDSVSALMPEAEAGKDLDENPQQAAAANALTRFFLHYLPMTTGFNGVNETTVFFVSQVRSNRKKSEAASHFAKYMKDWSAQGAWAAKHGKLIDIVVWSGSKDYQKTEAKSDGNGVGLNPPPKRRGPALSKTIQWEILKGKAGTHDGITGEVDYYYDTPPFTDDIHDLIVAAIGRDVIEENEGLLTFYRGADRKPDPQLTGIAPDAATALLKADFDLELAVRREVLATAGIRCLYR
jgi:RecA/RadA recombinase